MTTHFLPSSSVLLLSSTTFSLSLHLPPLKATNAIIPPTQTLSSTANPVKHHPGPPMRSTNGPTTTAATAAAGFRNILPSEKAAAAWRGSSSDRYAVVETKTKEWAKPTTRNCQ